MSIKIKNQDLEVIRTYKNTHILHKNCYISEKAQGINKY